MHGEFTYTPEDLREANRVAQKMARTKGNTYSPRRSPLGRGILGWVVFIALALLIVYIVTNKRPAPTTPVSTPPVATASNPVQEILIACVPWVVVIGFLYLVIFRNLRQNRARQADVLARPMEMDVSADGVVLTNGPTQTSWQWPAFSRHVETDRQFLLELEGANSWVSIPKRMFTDPSDLDAVRRMILANVGPRVGAFPVLPLGD